MTRYRIRTTRGEVYEISGHDPAGISRIHPGATITHTIQFDANGNGVPHVYTGQQPHQPSDVTVEPPPSDGDKSGAELEGKKADELRAIAKERGVEGYSAMTKPDLIAALTPPAEQA